MNYLTFSSPPPVFPTSLFFFFYNYNIQGSFFFSTGEFRENVKRRGGLLRAGG